MAGTFRNVWLHVWDKNYPQTIVELLEPIYYSLKQFASEMFYFFTDASICPDSLWSK